MLNRLLVIFVVIFTAMSNLAMAGELETSVPQVWMPVRVEICDSIDSELDLYLLADALVRDASEYRQEVYETSDDLWRGLHHFYIMDRDAYVAEGGGPHPRLSHQSVLIPILYGACWEGKLSLDELQADFIQHIQRTSNGKKKTRYSHDEACRLMLLDYADFLRPPGDRVESLLARSIELKLKISELRDNVLSAYAE